MPSLYLETTIISYLTSRKSVDKVIAARQDITKAWWEHCRNYYDLFISQAVYEEIRKGNQDAAARRLAVIENIPRMQINKRTYEFSRKLISPGMVPANSELDALHVAVCALNGIDY